MRWAFWRRRRSERSPEVASAPPMPRSAAREDEPDEPAPRTPAFSGATPDPGSRDVVVDARDDLEGLLDESDPELDAAGVRADVVALVEAALARDRTAAAHVLRRLESRGPDGPGMASIAAMSGLGDRCLAAAGFPVGSVGPGGAPSAAVVAQGDTVAARAEPLLRAVAPGAPRDLVRLVVRFACGVPDADPVVAHLVDAPPQDLALVAAVLLAQTVRDGGGDTDALAQELEDLLPG